MNTTVLRKYVDVGDALLGQPKNQFLSSDVRSFRNAPTRRSFFLEKAIVSMPKFQVYAGCCMIMQLASYRNGGAQGRINKKLSRNNRRIRNHHHNGPSATEKI